MKLPFRLTWLIFLSFSIERQPLPERSVFPHHSLPDRLPLQTTQSEWTFLITHHTFQLTSPSFTSLDHHNILFTLCHRLHSQQKFTTQISTAMGVFVWIYWDHNGHLHLQYQKVSDNAVLISLTFIFVVVYRIECWLALASKHTHHQSPESWIRWMQRIAVASQQRKTTVKVLKRLRVFAGDTARRVLPFHGNAVCRIDGSEPDSWACSNAQTSILKPANKATRDSDANTEPGEQLHFLLR